MSFKESQAYPKGSTSSGSTFQTVVNVVTIVLLVVCAALSLVAVIGIFVRTGHESTPKCRARPADPDASLKAIFSFGMNGRFASPSINFNYGKTKFVSMFNMTNTEATRLETDSRTMIQTVSGASLSVAGSDGERTSADGLFSLKMLVTSGPYDAMAIRDNTGYFCEVFDDDDEDKGHFVLAEGTMSVVASAYDTVCSEGCNYTGTYKGPVIKGDAWAYGIYRLTQGGRVRQWMMKSAVPGRAIGSPGDLYMILNENFRICSVEYGPGTQTLQVSLGYVPGSDNLFPVSLLNNARFEVFGGITAQPPWVDCDNPLG